jgi:catechol 2,3-dioxygenase-like lactoylglutathione lyase family enzyme
VESAHQATGPRLNLIVLYCLDPEACRDFYTGLGIAFTAEQHGKGPRHWAGRLADGIVLELYPVRADGTTGPLRLGLTVDGAAVEPRLPIGHRVLRDPDGRAVHLEVVRVDLDECE